MTDDDLGYLGHSKVAQVIRRHNWAESGLESPAEWTPELKAAVALCLRSEAIGAVYWGPDRRIIYNDQTIGILGDRHPSALGAPASEIWTQTWANLGPMMERVFRDGREIHGSNTRFALDSLGHPSEAYYNYSFTPIVDAAGDVAGIYGIGRETTPLVMAERFELLNRTGVVIAAETDLEKVVQAVTDAGVKLSGAQFGAFFYNVTNVQGESYMLYSPVRGSTRGFQLVPHAAGHGYL